MPYTIALDPGTPGILIGVCLALAAAPPAPAAERIPILIDTDIGTGIEDPFALALALGSEEVEVRGARRPARLRTWSLTES